jgi:hypothetical protein
MVIRLITLLGLLGTAFGLTYARWRARPAEDKRPYERWLWAGTRCLFTPVPWTRARAVLSAWTLAHYPVWTSWVFFALLASLAYQALSGFAFEIFIARGLYGLPLIGHMLGGGLFAASLAALLFWRGRSYRLDENVPDFFDARLRFGLKAMSPSYRRKLLFWAFAAFGFLQVATAVGSMLPVFTFAVQEAFLAVHRLSALGVVVSAALFADLVFIPRPRP